MIYACFVSNESVRLERYLSLSPRFSEVVRCFMLSLPLKRLRLWRCKHHLAEAR